MQPVGQTTVQLAEELAREPAITLRVKTEDLLLVALGVRECALATIPRDLPEAEVLGREVDQDFRKRMEGSVGLMGRVRDRVLRFAAGDPLTFKHHVLTEVFDRRLREFPPYTALRGWLLRLGLDCYETAIRPTIREMYVYRDPEVGERISDLVAIRRRLRTRAWREYRAGMAAERLIFPEQMDAEFLRESGKILGYPSCCVQRYIADVEGAIGAEVRASQQLVELSPEFEAWAYFASAFVPCEPGCEAAAAIGRRAHAALAKLGEGWASAYRQVLRDNMRLMREYPRLISEHEERLRLRAQTEGWQSQPSDEAGPGEEVKS